MLDFLHLPNLCTLSAQVMGDYYTVELKGLIFPKMCPFCQGSLYSHGSQRQKYMDTPMHGKRVLLEIDRKRYRCKICGKTFFEPLPAMDGKRLATTRLVRYIESQCLEKTFTDISREVGVDDKTIRHIFDDYVAGLKQAVVFETPEVMGIGELKIVGQYRTTITNVEKFTLFDMLPTRNKADLQAYFKSIPDKQNVHILNMDMCNVYRQVAHDQFPGRMIVADRFHVVRIANNALDTVRKTIRKGLETKYRLKLKDDHFILLSREHNLSDDEREKLEKWSKLFPMLGSAYKVKEAFHDIYRQPTKDEAMKAAKEWLDGMDKDVTWAFRETIEALHGWWTEIFNHYDYPISDDYTESINNIAKGMRRMGRGYSFEVIRARLLYDADAREDSCTTMHEEVMEETVVEYGPYLPTLARKLETGEFS